MTDDATPPFLTAVPEEWIFDSGDDLVENAFIAGMTWQQHHEEAEVAALRKQIDLAEQTIENLRPYRLYPKAARVLAEYDAAKEASHE